MCNISKRSYKSYVCYMGLKKKISHQYLQLVHKWPDGHHRRGVQVRTKCMITCERKGVGHRTFELTIWYYSMNQYYAFQIFLLWASGEWWKNSDWEYKLVQLCKHLMRTNAQNILLEYYRFKRFIRFISFEHRA